MSESKHTPTPWEVVSYSDKRTPIEIRTDKPLYPGASNTVLVAKLPNETVNPRANAAFIVKAVNAYEPMVEALLCILREAKNPESFKYDLQAIASNMLSAIGRHPDSVQP